MKRGNCGELAAGSIMMLGLSLLMSGDKEVRFMPETFSPADL